MKRLEPSGSGTVLLVAGLVGMAATTGIMTTATGQDTAMTPLFAPVEIGADLSALPNSERQALAHIVDAARVMDGIFLEQVWAGNPSMLLSLLNSDATARQATLDFFLLNKGPWSRIDENRPFVAGAPVKPGGANFYPAGATKTEVAAWFDQLEGRGAGRRDRVFYHDPARHRRRIRHRAIQRGVSGAAGNRGRASARGRPRHGAAHSPALPGDPCRRVRVQRLLRQRRRVDGAGLDDRTDNRAL